MQTLREQFHSVKGAEMSHENMTEEGLKSLLISSDNLGLRGLYQKIEEKSMLLRICNYI